MGNGTAFEKDSHVLLWKPLSYTCRIYIYIYKQLEGNIWPHIHKVCTHFWKIHCKDLVKEVDKKSFRAAMINWCTEIESATCLINWIMVSSCVILKEKCQTAGSNVSSLNFFFLSQIWWILFFCIPLLFLKIYLKSSMFALTLHEANSMFTTSLMHSVKMMMNMIA